MYKYLITFSNVFDHAKFKDNIEEYFMVALDGNILIKHYNSKFCEIQVVYMGYVDYVRLKRIFPGIKILRKNCAKKKVQYIKL